MEEITEYIDPSIMAEQLLNAIKSKINIGLEDTEIKKFLSLHLDKMKQRIIIGYGLAKGKKK